MGLILEASNGGGSVSNYITLGASIILLFIVIAIFAMGILKRNKYVSDTQKMIDSLQVGMKVKTYAGIYCEIIEIREALDGTKVALVKSGEGDKCSFYSIDLASVFSIDKKDDEVLSENIASENVAENNLTNAE